MAELTVKKCDICQKIFEYGIINLEGNIKYQRSPKHNIIEIKEGDYCLSCLNNTLNEVHVTMMFSDKNY